MLQKLFHTRWRSFPITPEISKGVWKYTGNANVNRNEELETM